MSTLYTAADNAEFDQKLSDRLTAVAAEAPKETAATEAPVDDIPTYEDVAAKTYTASSVEVPLDISKLTTLDSLRGLMRPTGPKIPLVRFKHKGQSSKIVKLDTTLLAPNRKLLTSRNFQQGYREQLDEIIYGQDKELNPDALMSLSMMFSFGKKNDDPILLKSQYYVRLLPVICSTLNAFFKQNQSIIENISCMISDGIRPEVTST